MSKAISPYVFPGCPSIQFYKRGEKAVLPYITIQDVIYTVCNRTGISLEQVRSKDRHRDIADTRAIIYYLCNCHMALTQRQILSHLQDNIRDRSCITTSRNKIADLMRNDISMDELVRRLQAQLTTINLDRQLETQNKAA